MRRRRRRHVGVVGADDAGGNVVRDGQIIELGVGEAESEGEERRPGLGVGVSIRPIHHGVIRH